MEIKIKNLTITNFKKIKNLVLTFDGKSINVYGTNKTGKTTIADAFSWLLFGKDSLGSANFAIKPRKSSGEEVHGLETTVESVLLIDGKEKTFKKVYKESYVKKRGEVDAVFSGHKTDCYINEEPISVSEYQKQIDSLINEDLFKMITSPSYFNQMHWSKQREIIFKLVPNVTDNEIIKSNPELKELLNHLVLDRTVDQLLKIAKDQNTKINNDLKTLPAKISVLADTKYSCIDEKYNDEKNEVELSNCYKKLSELEANKATGANTSGISTIESSIHEMEKDVRKLEDERYELVAKAEKEYKATISKKQDNLEQLKSSLRTNRRNIEREEEKKNVNISDGKVVKVKIDDATKKIDEASSQEFTPGKCSFCGQALPEEKIEELKAHFNLEKSNKLEALNKQLAELEAKRQSLYSDYDDIAARIKDLDAELDRQEKLVETLEAELKEFESAKPTVDTSKIDAEIDKINKRIETSRKAVDKLKTTSSTSIQDTAISELKNTIAYLSDKKAEYSLKLQNDERIKFLQADEKKLRSDFEDNISKITLCEKFVVAKAFYLQDKINANFETVKFDLFIKQLNGGIEETCVATVDGVPYPSVNNADRINAGLDIIKSLQKINDVKAPIFIDNAESTVKFIDLDCQMFKLYVSKEDKELRFEVEEE